MASTNTTTTVTTTTNTRDGTKLVVDSVANTVSIGNVVTDVSLQPYIAPRIISFFAYNLRPGQRIHVFFDSVNVDQYCAPAIVPTSITNTSDYQSIQKNGNWGDAIYADERGSVAGQFNVPAATFKTGDRVLQVTNVDSLTLGTDAIVTSASATFTASNLSVTKQNITLTTVNAELSFQEVTETVVQVSTNVVITQNPDIYNITANYIEPIAQGLTINTPNGDAGVFATSLDIYFKQKSLIATNGVTVYLCEVDNGYPNGRAILPFSTVHKNYEDINTSEDATVKTRFVFDAPVFLANDRQYAFIVRPDANDPDYFVYSANLGDLDITTGAQVFQQPLVGTAFYGATMTQWTALQSEYIKFQLNIANFTQATGNAIFKNANTDYFEITNIAYANSSVGLLPGDYVFQAPNTTPSQANTSQKALFGYYDTLRGVIYADNSTGNFTANSTLQFHRFANASVSNSPNTTTLIATALLDNIYDPKMDAIVAQFATIVPPGCAIDYTMTGTSNTYGIDASERKIVTGYETEFYDRERIVASKSNEVTSMSGNKSLSMRAALSTDSGFLSPLIDTVRRQQLIIGNDVDPIEFKYEEFFTDGRAKAKYISKVVTLRDGMDSEDLQVILTAFRPPSSDIQVWARFVNSEDPEPISQKIWAPMINNGENLYSDPSNPQDMREFMYSMPTFYGLKPLTGTITANTASSNVVGSSTAFTTELEPGWYVNMLANSTHSEVTRKVISITNNEFMTLSGPLTANYASQPMFLVTPPQTPYLSTNTATLLTGNVTVSTSNNTITGSGTAFTTQLAPGSIIKVAGDSQTVVSITNNTFLSVGKPWSSSASGANAYNVTPAGISYLNSNSSLFTTFKRFQIKIILQSNDSSKVPLIDDAQCLAMLMGATT